MKAASLKLAQVHAAYISSEYILLDDKIFVLLCIEIFCGASLFEIWVHVHLASACDLKALQIVWQSSALQAKTTIENLIALDMQIQWKANWNLGNMQTIIIWMENR